tara:strand:- start:414 stop:662 length:249 start_codon:yes stop_codon:yes gene_type:complete
MSKLQVNDIVNKDDDGAAGFSKGAVVTGVTTSTSFSGNVSGTTVSGTTVSGTTVSVGGTSVNALIDNKTSPGKAIALSMVFG